MSFEFSNCCTEERSEAELFCEFEHDKNIHTFHTHLEAWWGLFHFTHEIQ